MQRGRREGGHSCVRPPPPLTELTLGGKGSPTVFRAKMYIIHAVMIIFRLTEGLLGSLLPLKLSETFYGIARLLKGGSP